MKHARQVLRLTALGRLAAVAAIGAIVAGCGIQSAAPLNRAAMGAGFGQTFPGLVIMPGKYLR